MWRILVYILGRILNYLGYIGFVLVPIVFTSDSLVTVLLYVLGCYAVLIVSGLLEEVSECF